jgi:hypothetical protein
VGAELQNLPHVRGRDLAFEVSEGPVQFGEPGIVGGTNVLRLRLRLGQMQPLQRLGKDPVAIGCVHSA